MISADMLRELGAEVIVFRNLRRALKWYFDHQEMRYAVPAPPLEIGHHPRSVEARQRDTATWAVLYGCLRDTPNAFRLVDWHYSYVPQQQLCADWGYPNVFTMRWTMRRTEDLLRGRMEDRGLLGVT